MPKIAKFDGESVQRNVKAMKMIHIALPDSGQRHLPFYLAMEEWVAAKLPAADYFFCWQVRPTVIFGRNQSIDTEVDLEYCNSHNIEVYRRKSGGGCVFADMHNIMFSYITPTEEVTTTFSRYTETIAAMLRSLGLDAEATGRNDVTIGGRKVSGNSFYHVPGRSIVHGTMLYDTDLEHMAHAITPSRSKLESKQVQSVSSRITTLSKHLTMDIDAFKRFACDFLTDSKITLTAEQIAEIEALSQPYFMPECIFGRHCRTALNRTRRIEGSGEFTVGIELKGGLIADITVGGDFFQLCDIDSALLARLRGTRYTPDDIRHALSDIDVSQIIAGLSTSEFIKLLIQ